MEGMSAIRAEIDANIKREADAVLEQLGLTPPEAIELLYRQIALEGKLPF